MDKRRSVMLVILDGVGSTKKYAGNAVALAKPDFLIKSWNSNPHTYLKASGEDVGLPAGTCGNSEVGHLNIGAGKKIYQNLPKINRSIEKGLLDTNRTLLDSIKYSTQNEGRIHLMGCFSDGSVHAHIDHFIAIANTLIANSDRFLYIHPFTDGRDTGARSAITYIDRFKASVPSEKNRWSFADVIGRALAMDRNKAWNKTEIAYKMLFDGIGKQFSSIYEAIDDAYKNSISDEYIPASIVNPDGLIKKGDSLIFLNYRADRAVQLSQMIQQEVPTQHQGFHTEVSHNIFFAGMVEYGKNLPQNVLFPKEFIKIPIGRVIAENGLTQLRIAESEKYPHVTYFFNGGVPLRYWGETDIEIPSPKVATYDQQPEMSLPEVSKTLIEEIKSEKHNFIVLNIANGDMVGHTGNLDAGVSSIKYIDAYLSQIVRTFIQSGGIVVITADHGNVEEMIKQDSGDIDTEHSLNVVPFIILNSGRDKMLRYGSLMDIAPTILDLLNLPKPNEMIGETLIVR